MFSYTTLFWMVSAVTTLLRLFVVGQLGLGDDEAHYWAYSQNPDYSYFDHPPAIGYLIKWSTSLFGANEFAVRLPAVLLFLFMSYFVFQLAKKMYGEKAAFWSVVLLQVTPVFSFLGAVLTVPDAPLAFFWMLFIYLFWRLLETGQGGYWYALGAALGLGLLSKYNMVLLPASIFFFLLFSQKHRQWFTRKEPYLACMLAALLFLPVVLWNIENGWASFGFQLRHGFGKSAPQFSFELLGRSLGAQAGYISPLLFIIFWGILFRLLWNVIRKKDERSLFLFSFSFPTLFLFNGVASFNEILPHWPATGYLVLVIAAVYWTMESWHKRWVRVASYCSWGLGLFLTLLVPLQALYKILPAEKFMPAAEAQKIEDGIVKAEKVDVTNELYGWDEAGKRIAEIIESSPDPKPFIFTHRHYIASQLNFYVSGHPKIYCLSDRIDAYDFWQRDLSALQGRDGIFVVDNRFYSDPQGVYPFAAWEKPELVEVYRKGKKIRLFTLTAGKQFDAAKLTTEFTAERAGRYINCREVLRRYDHQLFLFINKDRDSKALDLVMQVFTTIGNGLPLAAVVGVVLWFTRRERFWKEFLFACAIILAGGILVQLLKEVFARVRPPTVFGDQARVLGEKLFRCSFPSGHSQASFSAATFLTMRLQKYGWLFFPVAFFSALSRAYVGVHFPIDIVVGSLIGVLTTWCAVKYVKLRWLE